MSDVSQKYHWRLFNWGLAFLVVAIWGLPHGWAELFRGLWTLLNLDEAANMIVKNGWAGVGQNYELPLVIFISFGTLHYFLGPIWKNRTAFSIDHDGLDYPMRFTRKLNWDEIAEIELVGPKLWRQLRLTLKDENPPRREMKGPLGRLDEWVRKIEPGTPHIIMLSGWQIDFDRNELAALMNELKGGHHAPPLSTGPGTQQC